MACIGYARVSDTDQDLDIQKERLKAAGCEIIRSETGSGASRTGHSELDTIMQFLHTDDELHEVVTAFRYSAGHGLKVCLFTLEATYGKHSYC